MEKYKKKIFDRNAGDIEAAVYSKFTISILYILSAIVLEIAMFIIMDLGFAPYYISFDFAIIFILASVMFVMPSMNMQKIFFAVFILIQMVIVMANCSLYKYHGDVFSLGILGFAKEGAAVLDLYMLEAKCIPVFILVAVADLYMFSFVGKVSPRKFPVTRKTIAGILAMFMGCMVFGVAFYNVGKLNLNKNENDKYLYETLMFRNSSMSKFGSFTYYYREITGKALDTISSDKSKEEVISYLSNYTPVDNSGNPYLQNAGQGVIKNDNVLAVLMESVEWYMIDPLLTPTLYKLYNGYNFSLDNSGREIGYGDSSGNDKRGIVFKNYYSKSKTDFTEASVILGSYPYYEAFSSHVNYTKENTTIQGYDFGFSMPNMLKEHTQIEEARYLHTYLKSFYGRTSVFPVYGFDKLLFLEDFDVPYNVTIGNPILDSDAVDVELPSGERVMDYLLPVDSPFFSLYATISTHGPYTYFPELDKYFREIDRLAKTGQIRSEITKDSTVTSAMAKAMDIDNCFSKIIAHLQETGLIDNTTLLLFSDHQAYYHAIDLNYKKITNNFESAFDPERYRIPGLIYSTKLPYYEADRFINYFDYAPTLFDLMDIKYNPNVYLGNSLFSEEGSPCIISRTGGVLNDRIFTMDGNILKFKKDDVTPAEVKEFSANVNKLIQKWDYIDYMYYYNLYGQVARP